MMECPDCKGKKESFGIGCGDQGCRLKIFGIGCGDQGCRLIEMKCFRCKGIGKISQEMMKWIETGKKIRETRLKKDISLREEAKRLNMLPTFYSDIESGRVENLNWLQNV